jgi:hypothetical protein
MGSVDSDEWQKNFQTLLLIIYLLIFNSYKILIWSFEFILPLIFDETEIDTAGIVNATQ